MRRARILLLALGATLILASPAAAAKPEKVQVSDIGILDEFLTDACDFDVFFDVTGHFTVHTWLDAEGNPTRELINFALKARFYTAAAEIRTVDVGVDRLTFNPDGSILQAVVGNVGSLQVPGHGRVYSDVGQTVVLVTFSDDPEEPPTFEVLRQSGQHTDFELDPICDHLAG